MLFYLFFFVFFVCLTSSELSLFTFFLISSLDSELYSLLFIAFLFFLIYFFMNLICSLSLLISYFLRSNYFLLSINFFSNTSSWFKSDFKLVLFNSLSYSSSYDSSYHLNKTDYSRCSLTFLFMQQSFFKQKILALKFLF